ncbi:hypothetical protein Tco_0994518 [Tanacetum coccineum]
MAMWGGRGGAGGAKTSTRYMLYREFLLVDALKWVFCGLLWTSLCVFVELALCTIEVTYHSSVHVVDPVRFIDSETYFASVRFGSGDLWPVGGELRGAKLGGERSLGVVLWGHEDAHLCQPAWGLVMPRCDNKTIKKDFENSPIQSGSHQGYAKYNDNSNSNAGGKA